MQNPPSRRHFLRACAATAAALVAGPGNAGAHAGAHAGIRRRPHPTPRPGITGDKVLTAAQLGEDRKDLVPLFDGVRAIPEIVDGIRCHCGCATQPGYYSLLSCYEGEAMGKWCPICKGAGRLAVRLRREGKTLDEIRVAVDAQFG